MKHENIVKLLAIEEEQEGRGKVGGLKYNARWCGVVWCGVAVMEPGSTRCFITLVCWWSWWCAVKEKLATAHQSCNTISHQKMNGMDGWPTSHRIYNIFSAWSLYAELVVHPTNNEQ